jgi:succinate-semialdehyde dehydrogenase / glutarate-semialdehyde dehydrogenase
MAIATINPTTGATEREFDPIDAAEVERKLANAHEAVVSLRATTFEQRATWMRAAADLLEGDVEAVARILTIEMGKPIAQARAEVLKCAKNMRFYAAHAEGFLADEQLADPSAVGASSAWTRWQPLGVVLAVMPWNYPLWQVIRFAAPALMAGNAGVLKHASNVPQAAIYLDDLFTRGGFPVGAFQTILIGSREVEAVIRDPRVVAVTLTGSEPAGRSVAATAGSEIKKLVLELGGSDPFIVMPSADLERAATIAATARLGNNGQSCIAAKRFIAHTDIYDEFAALFEAKLAAAVVGDPLDEATTVGPVATEAGRAELAELVDDALAKGAIARLGGALPDGPGWFYPPTLLEGVTEDMRLFQEETFGPVAVLYRARDAAHALDLANVTTFGLSSAVWTTDPDDEEFFVNAIDAGAVFINGMTISYPELPFGGIKNSGYGRELGAPGIREFCNLKTVWKG